MNVNTERQKMEITGYELVLTCTAGSGTLS